MTAKTGNQKLIEQFLADGIKYMFGNPGTVEQGFLDAATQYADFKYILTLQESVPVAIADAYARATGRPALVQLHSSPGLGNGIGMLYQAMRGHSPLVVINGDAGVRYDAMEAQMAADLVGMARPVTKWSTRVLDPSSLLRVMRRAIKVAATPPMGPVFVSLPMDVLDAVNDEEVVPTSFPSTRVAPQPQLVDEIAALLASAERPLFIVGDGVAFSEAQAELTRVAELAGAEVWGADAGEVNMDATHPQWRGQLGHMFGLQSAPITSRADAVLIVGTYVFPEVFPALSGVFAPGARVAHIDLDAAEIAKNFPVDIGVVADPKTTLAQLAPALKQRMTAEQQRGAAERAAALATRKQEELESQRRADRELGDRMPLHPARFMEELASQISPDAIIFDEALTVSPDLTRYLPASKPGHFFQTRGGSLGVGIPGAIGLKLLHPDKQVIGFTGDGGSMYTIQALWTAAHHEIGAKFVICNNHSYKLLKLNIQQYWRDVEVSEHEFPAAFDITGPDIRFDRLAESMGVPALRVKEPADVRGAIEKMLAHNGPFLIDLVIGNEVPGHDLHCPCGQ